MEPLRPFVIGVVFAGIAAAVVAQEVPDPLRALREMEVSGETVFPRDRVAMELVADADTMRELLRGLDVAAAEVVAERVCELHRRGGYANAKATGKVAGGVLHIALEAGTRYRCGEVRCTGNSALATEALAAACRAGGERPWAPTQFPNLAADAAERTAKLVVDAYRAVGRHGAQATVALAPDGEAMALAITIADEGRELRIRSLRLDGEGDAAAAAVLGELAFAPDVVATSAVLAGLQRELESTGRYQTVDVAIPEDAPAVLDPLVVSVQLRTNAPAPGALHKRDIAQVGRAMDVVAAHLQRGDVVAVELDGSQSDGSHFFSGKMSFRAGSNGFAMKAERCHWGGREWGRAVFGCTTERLWYELGGVGGTFDFPTPVAVQFRMATALGDGDEMQLSFNVGFSTGAGSGLQLDIHPATAAQLLAKASDVRRDGETLMVQLEDAALLIAADGELTSGRITVGAATMSWAEGFAKPPGSARSTAQLVTVLGTLVADALAAAAKTDARLAALVRGSTLAAATLEPTKPSVASEPPIASLGEPGSTMAVIGRAVAWPAVSREYDGHLVDLAAAAASLMLGQTRQMNARLGTIVRSERHGSLSLAILARAWSLLGNERAAATFRKVAVEEWSFDSIYGDLAELGASFESLRAAPARIGAAWRTQPELQELLAGVPEGEAGDLAAWRKGLELLWTSGGEKVLRDLLLK